MEKSTNPEGVGGSPEILKSIIEERELPLYEQAAVQTGYTVEVTARVGNIVEEECLDTQGRMRPCKVILPPNRFYHYYRV